MSCAAASAQKPKLSYKDQRELEELPEKIEQLEVRQSELEKTISEPDFYGSDQSHVDGVLKELAEVQSQLETTFARWEALDGGA